MKSKTDIVIIGGGIGGAALALFLRKQGLSATVYEARLRRGQSSGGLGIAPNGMRILSELGLADRVRSLGCTYKGFEFLNSSGRVLASYQDQSPEINPEYGVSLSRQALHEVLLDALSSAGIPIHFGRRVEAIENILERPTCRFTDGESVSSAILIGADGLSSRVRSTIFPDVVPSYTGLIGMGGFIPADLFQPQWLPPADRMRMIFGKSGFFGLAGAEAQNGRATLMWWSALPEPQSDRASVLRLSHEEKRARLLRLHQGWCPPVEDVLRAATDIFADNLYDIPPMERWHRGNICLMGDAAHAVSPHSGQGASMALEDAWELARALSQDLDSPSHAFDAFQKARNARVNRVIRYGRQSGDSKKELGKLAVWARDRFVALLLPRLARGVARWMYRSPVDSR